MFANNCFKITYKCSPLRGEIAYKHIFKQKKVAKKPKVVVPRETKVTIPKDPAKPKVVKKPEVKRIEKEEKKDKVDTLLDSFFKRGRK